MHCDIKPDNILLAEDANLEDLVKDPLQAELLYLIDFGLTTCYLDGKQEHVYLENVEEIRGNNYYMSLAHMTNMSKQPTPLRYSGRREPSRRSSKLVLYLGVPGQRRPSLVHLRRLDCG